VNTALTTSLCVRKALSRAHKCSTRSLPAGLAGKPGPGSTLSANRRLSFHSQNPVVESSRGGMRSESRMGMTRIRHVTTFASSRPGPFSDLPARFLQKRPPWDSNPQPPALRSIGIESGMIHRKLTSYHCARRPCITPSNIHISSQLACI
jgi:hypothetical protein